MLTHESNDIMSIFVGRGMNICIWDLQQFVVISTCCEIYMSILFQGINILVFFLAITRCLVWKHVFHLKFWIWSNSLVWNILEFLIRFESNPTLEETSSTLRNWNAASKVTFSIPHDVNMNNDIWLVDKLSIFYMVDGPMGKKNKDMCHAHNKSEDSPFIFKVSVRIETLLDK